jgi:hypothetical protein
MLSERAQFGAFALTSYVILKVAESILYRFSAIGDTSPLGNLLNACVSMTYGWIPDCLPPSRISFQKRIDAEDHEGGKRRGVFTLSGRMDAENVAEMKALFGSEPKGRCIVLDLKDLTLVDRDAVRFLESCETDSIKIKNCPAYIREWITRERAGSGD